MDPRFNDLFTDPSNAVFQVVFFPDRIYHAQYLNASRSPRYRYNVQEVRSKSNATILKGQVYMDGNFLTNFLRIEYRATRLVEQARTKNRRLRGNILAWVRVRPTDEAHIAEATIKLEYCDWTSCYQAEVWQTLEPPPNTSHDIGILDQMGYNAPITRIPQFATALSDLRSLKRVDIAFRENDVDLPAGYTISDALWDNNFTGSHQEPRTQEPSSPFNTISDENYEVNFQRGFFIDAAAVQPVRYLNGMMDADNPEAGLNNIIEMRWLVQRDMGSSVVFFHEVTIPPHTTEGTHQHIGSEELYYVIGGEGFVYMGEGDNDDPIMDTFEKVDREIYGLGIKPCRKIPMKPGRMIFTKSGGIHGIQNPNDTPLKFVAFLYHAT